MIQLFMRRNGSSAIVPLQFPASQSAIAEASRQLDEANREGKTKIVEIKSVITNLPSYLSRLDPDSRTQLAQLNRLSSIIAQMDSRERNIYAGALDGNSINDLNDVIRVAEQISDYILIPNINSDVTLGRYVAVAGQIQGDPRFPEAAWPYLDFAKIGAEYYAEHGGAYRNTTGFRYETLTEDPQIRKAVDDIILDFSGEENPRRACSYGLTEKGMQMLRDVADPSLPHTYSWFVMTGCNTPQEQLHRNLTLDEAVELYQNSDYPEKRLGVTKDDFATVDFVRMVDGEQTFFGDYQKLESFKNDPTIFEAVEQLHQELEDMSQDQGMTM